MERQWSRRASGKSPSQNFVLSLWFWCDVGSSLRKNCVRHPSRRLKAGKNESRQFLPNSDELSSLGLRRLWILPGNYPVVLQMLQLEIRRTAFTKNAPLSPSPFLKSYECNTGRTGKKVYTYSKKATAAFGLVLIFPPLFPAKLSIVFPSLLQTYFSPMKFPIWDYPGRRNQKPSRI